MLLQIAAAVNALISCGVGLTMTETVWPNGPLLQPFALVITVYGTVMGFDVALVNNSPTDAVPLLGPSFIPGNEPLLHEYDAPVVSLEKVYPNIDPLQIAGGVNDVLICGVGLTTTVTD